MNSTVKIIIAAIAGALAGTVTGLLLAPTSGKEAREKITEKTDEVLEYLNDFAARLRKVNLKTERLVENNDEEE